MRGPMRSAVISFLAGVVIVFAAAGIFLLLGGSVGGGSSGQGASPTPTTGPYPVLADGQYIDSLARVPNTTPTSSNAVPLPYLASKIPAIAVVEVTGIVDTIVPTPDPAGTPTPIIRKFQPLPWTTYNAKVKQWIKGGSGETETTISILGGNDYDGARLLTGTFLPQVGRTYLMVFDVHPTDSPASGAYEGVAAGWAFFEISDDGKIHVLNENNSRKFMGGYSLMPLDDFVTLVREWIVGPPAVTLTPPPSPTSSP